MESLFPISLEWASSIDLTRAFNSASIKKRENFYILFNHFISNLCLRLFYVLNKALSLNLDFQLKKPHSVLESFIQVSFLVLSFSTISVLTYFGSFLLKR